MAAIITKDTRLLNARAFVESVSESENTVYYVFLGRPTTWPIEYAPPQAVDNYATQRDVWNNMEAMKLVTTNDVIHAIPRYNWTLGNIYAQYNDRIPSSNLFDSRYFVINSEYNVYKCLSNGHGAANVTVNAPTGTGGTYDGLIKNTGSTQDYYVWKFMYTIPAGSWVKFGTTSFIPVLAASADTLSKAGNVQGIYGYNIVSANLGESTSVTDGLYYLKVVGTGDNNANAVVRITGGDVANLTVKDYGNLYSKAKVTGLIYGSTTFAVGNVVIEPILSPPGGHGSDTIDELGGIYAMVNVRFEQTDAPIIPIDNFKFRQIGVIKDPLLSTSFHPTEKIPTLTTANSLLRAYSNIEISGSITNSDKLISGAVITGTNGANATVVGYSGTVINYIQSESSSSNVEANFKAFNVSDSLFVGTSGIGVINKLGNAAVSPYSGEIIYIDNRNVITRATDQVEDVYVVIEF